MVMNLAVWLTPEETKVFGKISSTCLLFCTLAWGSPAVAAEASEGPTKIVVASAPGGNLDVLARILAEQMSTATSRSFFVENKAGAGGNIATAQVALAKPDGRTLLVVSTSHTSNIHLYRKVGYDPIKSFTPISSLAESAFAVAVPVTSSYQSLSDLVAAAKANPGQLNYGSSGIGQGNHLGMELLKSRLGMDLVHVPFTSAGAVTTALMGAQVDVAMLTLPGAFAGLEAGKLRILGVTGNRRVEKIDSVPTIQETTGVDFDLTAWQGLVAPAGLPPDQAVALSKQIAAVLAMPQVVEQLDRVALTPKTSTPDEFGRFLVRETARWGDVIQQANIRVE
ncbi:Tripartite tricarboxylate transporter substrate binding protein [Bordetella tumbae]